MQLVHQPVGEEGPYQRAAAADVDAAVDALLDAADGRGGVRPGNLGVAPRRVPQGGGDDVFGCVVHEGRTGVLLGRPRRPGRLEHLVGGAAKQNRLATAHQLTDRLTHPGVVAVVECPRGRVDDAVEAHELVHPDGSHLCLPSFRVRSGTADDAARRHSSARDGVFLAADHLLLPLQPEHRRDVRLRDHFQIRMTHQLGRHRLGDQPHRLGSHGKCNSSRLPQRPAEHNRAQLSSPEPELSRWVIVRRREPDAHSRRYLKSVSRVSDVAGRAFELRRRRVILSGVYDAGEAVWHPRDLRISSCCCRF